VSVPTGSSGNDAALAALDAHRPLLEGMHLREAFARDPDRARRYQIKAAGLTLDYSRNLIRGETLELLTALADSSGVVSQRTAMLGGEAINLTEGRAVLHTLLRGTDAGRPLAQTGDVLAARERMAALVGRVRGGAWRGWGGESIR